MNELQIFKNEAFGQITTIEKDGDPWFVAKEISGILDYNQTSDMTKRLDDDEKVDQPIWSINEKRNRNQTIINESGFYNAVIGSKKPEAKKFKKWVTSEVLPSIRKTGSYSNLPKTYIEALENLVVIEKEKQKALLQIEQDKPKVEFADHVTKEAESIRIGEYAKVLSKVSGVKIGSNKLMRYFRERGYLMRGRDSYEFNKPHQKVIDAGLFEFKMERPKPHLLFLVPYITGKGQFDLKDEVLNRFC